MPLPTRPWRPFTANCCVVEEGAVLGNLSRCRPTRSDLSKMTASLPPFRRLSLANLREGLPLSVQLEEGLAFGAGLYSFQLSELKAITHNFSSYFLLGEGGFGPVFKGYIDEALRQGLRAQPVAVKLLNTEGLQGHREWLAEVFFLGRLRHHNLVKLIGYCCEDKDRLLVYEFMPRGSLENHLFRRSPVSLSWGTRLKIAIGAAKGLAFLHNANKPVIYRDFKTSNILLDSDFTAKLSDFGLAKLGPDGEETHVTTRVMGTHGYAAPEYVMTGHLTTKSDVYSFGVVLLELMTGRRNMDRSKPKSEENIVEWAKPYLKSARKVRYIMDPRLGGQYSYKGAREAAALSLRCLSVTPKDRPCMVAVVQALLGLQNMKDMAVNSGSQSATPMAGRRVLSARAKAGVRVTGARRNAVSAKLTRPTADIDSVQENNR